MVFSKAFELAKAGDSDLCTRGLSQTSYKKLDLDDFNHGAYKNTVNFWFRDLEFNIRRDIMKMYKNNRFSNFTTLPFIWEPCFQFDSPEDSPHFGIPNSPLEFKEFKEKGFYKNTPVEFITITKSRSRQKSVSKKQDDSDIPGFELIEGSELLFPESEYRIGSSLTGETRTVKELEKAFCKFFAGVEPERLPVKDARKKVWSGIFESEILAEIREAIKTTVIILLAVIPSLYEGSFKQNRIRSWQAFKDLIRKYLKVADPKQDPFILLTAIKILSNPACRVFNVESKMITYRDLCLEHFHGNSYDGSEIELGENVADQFLAKNEAPSYDATHNLLGLQLILSSEPAEKVKSWKEDIKLNSLRE